MPQQDERTIQEMIDVFLDTAGAKSPHTRRTYGAGIEHFVEFLPQVNLSPTLPARSLTLQHARQFGRWLAHDYKDKGGDALGARSRAIYLIAVARLYRTLMDEKTITIELLDYDNLRKYYRDLAGQLPRFINDKLPKDWMVDALLEAASQPPTLSDKMGEARRNRLMLIWRRNLAMILALRTSGMRVGELCSLKRKDLDYDEHAAYVTGKGGKRRRVLFSTEAWQATMDYLDARQDSAAGGALEDKPLFCRHDRGASDRRLPLSPFAVRDTFTRLAEEADIARRFNITPHSLRHYFATQFLGHTGNLALTQDVLGHADPRTTRIYAKTTDEAIKQAHRELFDEKE